ncbi:MAG: hypothetical protein NWE89_02775 [Candidatus Bathyarchaeota archaeon]|nr:hypothetical protein [Candidatus Bathyarchaeota archaeon]
MVLEVSQEEAASFNVRRHHLEERAPKDNACEVIADIVGLNAQFGLNYHLSLWNRVEGRNTEYLQNALYVDKSLVRR